MVYFLPFIAPTDGEGGIGLLLNLNLFLNLIPCILSALALFAVAWSWGIRRPWLALIPVADLWMLGSLSDSYQKRVRGKEKQMRMHLTRLGTAALGSVLLVAAVTWLLFLAWRMMALCDLYTGFARGRPAVYIIFSILCPPLIPFFVFRCK